MDPYIIEHVPVRRWNPDFPQDEQCTVCQHPYHRHFDSYDDWAPVGCKYCPCYIFNVGEPGW